MTQRDKLSGLFHSALGVCLLFSCAAINAQGISSQEDGNIKNPKECVQTEIVWEEERISDANSLISDYFFSYPEGIRVTNRCDTDISGHFGVDAFLNGTFGNRTTTLQCEAFTIFSGAKTNFMKFPEIVRDAAKRYHHKRARRLASGREPDIWANLYWDIDYRGCVEWCDEAMKIETGYWHRCKDIHFYPPCPISSGHVDNWDPDFYLSGEVVQDGSERERQATHEKLREQTALERQPAGEMVSIPAGAFRMGDLSGEGYDEYETPVRIVTVPAFRLGKYEVTFAQWDACVADGGCNGYTPSDEIGCGRDSRAVNWVSWYDVQSFIDWLNSKTGGNYRLPTEAEWEYAARAGTTTNFSWGNEVGSNRASCYKCGSQWDRDQTAPVGSFPANAWGLHDMHGNVEEWVQDCWNESYEGAPTDGSAWTSGDCDWGMARGGSRDRLPERLRSASRDAHGRSTKRDDRGFRLAQDQ